MSDYVMLPVRPQTRKRARQNKGDDTYDEHIQRLLELEDAVERFKS